MNLLINADSRHIPIADKSVHCIVTSPPYYGLRDYGTATWVGGDTDCDHKPGNKSRIGASGLQGGTRNSGHLQEGYGEVCGKCGAIRFDHQIGLEPTPDEYVAGMVQVFREVWRVLRDDGTVWLNLGDSYAGSGKGTYGDGLSHGTEGDKQKTNAGSIGVPSFGTGNGLKPKELIGIPWMVAFALRAEGWYLRSDIIWHKPNPMPESVRDRPTKAHEYIFLLTKSAKYYYDQEATLEPASPNTHLRVSQDVANQIGSERANGGQKTNGPMKAVIRTPKQDPTGARIKNNQSWDASTALPVIKRNMHSVWTVTTKSYSGAHYATFPPDLIEPCILAGTSEKGVCPKCGAPWERMVNKSFTDHDGIAETGYEVKSNAGRLALLRQAARKKGGEYYCNKTTVGWQPICDCGIEETIPATVLDPFVGSGTTLMVARKHGRNGVGLDLSFEYLNINARERLVYGGFIPIAEGIQQITIDACQ